MVKVIIQAFFEVEQYNFIIKMADKAGISRSKVLRNIVDEYMKSQLK